MKFNNEKGFTVIELILSFAFVMVLAVGMFSLVNNYRIRQQKESINRDLLTLKTTLTQDIYEDMQMRKVEKIEYCRDNNEIIKQCINIYFMDGTAKQLKITNKPVIIEDDGTEFEIETFEIVYGNIKYKNPDPKFTTIVSDYILTYSTEEDNLEFGTLYKIKIRMKHQDIKDEYVIDVVTTGTD